MESQSTGTVTFLFTDIEGSTERWQRNDEAMSDALSAHDQLIRSVVERHGGVVVGTPANVRRSVLSSPASSSRPGSSRAPESSCSPSFASCSAAGPPSSDSIETMPGSSDDGRRRHGGDPSTGAPHRWIWAPEISAICGGERRVAPRSLLRARRPVRCESDVAGSFVSICMSARF